jgi:hypothetical protein
MFSVKMVISVTLKWSLVLRKKWLLICVLFVENFARISITFRRMDESKRPAGYIPEPDLQGIQPLAYEAEQEEKKSTVGENGENRPHNHYMRRDNRRGGRIDGMGSAPRSDRFSEPREWTQNSPRSAPTRNNRYSEPREWNQNSQRYAPMIDSLSPEMTDSLSLVSRRKVHKDIQIGGVG